MQQLKRHVLAASLRQTATRCSGRQTGRGPAAPSEGYFFGGAAVAAPGWTGATQLIEPIVLGPYCT
jgi:hypothetical protein